MLFIFFNGNAVIYCLIQLRVTIHNDPLLVTREAVSEEKESKLILATERLSLARKLM